MTGAIPKDQSRLRRWLPLIGALVGVGALLWVLRGLDRDRFLDLLVNADIRLMALVPLTNELLADSDKGAEKGALFDASRALSTLIGRPTTTLASAMKEALASA